MPLRLRATNAPPIPAAFSTARPGDSVCGYRLVRKLGDGPRAEVFLGFGESAVEDSPPATAVLKICRTDAAGSATTELEALARAEHPHVVRLIDASTTPDGTPCLVLERLSRGSLAHLLERRDTLASGELVTILAPIAAAVDALHASGVVHGGIGAASVLFRDSGAPVLARFGRAVLIEPGLAAASLSPVAETDARALAELASLVIERVAHPEAAELVAWVRGARTRDGFGALLVDRLFAFADAVPVAFDSSPATRSAVPARVITGTINHRAETRSVRERVRGLVPITAAGATGIVARLREVRTPVWVAAASVVIAIVAASVLIPAGSDGTPAHAAGLPTDHAPTSAPAPSSTPTIEDPVDALGALILQRRSCLDDLSVLCLDGVDQSGSAALDDDADLIRGIRSGGEIPDSARLGAVSPRLVERLGDSALIDLRSNGKPASVLVIRTEAGWRIRDYLD